MTPSVSIDTDESERLYREVEHYYAEHVQGRVGPCVCSSLQVCRSSIAANTSLAEGQLSHVGRYFSAQVDGVPWRIAVVSAQHGRADSPVTMPQRRQAFDERAQQAQSQRNPHIQGVMNALRVLWGRDPGSDRPGEVIASNVGSVNLLGTTALINAVLCSHLDRRGSADGKGTREMHDNCARHLRAVLAILRPTVILSQGRVKDQRARSTLTSVVAAADEVHWVTDEVAHIRFGDHESVLIALYHPTRHWSSPNMRYWSEVAEPALKLGRQLAGAGALPGSGQDTGN